MKKIAHLATYIIKAAVLALPFLYPSYSLGNECDSSDRIRNYSHLKLQLSDMHDLLPALKPQDKAFYKEVSENLYSKPEKYKRYLSDDGYVVYENTIVIQNLLHWAEIATNSAKNDNYTSEVHAFSRLMLGAVQDVRWLESLRDSEYMSDRGIVPGIYKNKGADVSLTFGAIALCMADHAETLLKQR